MCFQCLKRLPKERSSLQNSTGPAAKNNLDSFLPRGGPTPAIAAHPLTKPPVAFRPSRLSAARRVLTLALWGDLPGLEMEDFPNCSYSPKGYLAITRAGPPPWTGLPPHSPREQNCSGHGGGPTQPFKVGGRKVCAQHRTQVDG